MKIAYLIAEPVLIPSHGVRIQALSWKKGLEALGHQVDLIDLWNANDWASYDAIHFFSFNDYLREFINTLAPINPRIVLSPIIDANNPPYQYQMASYLGCPFLRLYSKYYSMRCIKDRIQMYFVRSQYEKQFISKSYGVPDSRIAIVPLSCRLDSSWQPLEKEPFCLHVSLLHDARKNVRRLIQAAREYQFNLVLAGKLRNEQERKTLETWMEGSPNVSYRGFLSEDELLDLYRRAKVFALPSIYEGVGLVALEAAVLGCNVVLTNKGAPKEYYGDLARTVDPYSVRAIGKAILAALQDHSSQPALREHILSHYSLDSMCKLLVESYRKVRLCG